MNATNGSPHRDTNIKIESADVNVKNTSWLAQQIVLDLLQRIILERSNGKLLGRTMESQRDGGLGGVSLLANIWYLIKCIAGICTIISVIQQASAAPTEPRVKIASIWDGQDVNTFDPSVEVYIHGRNLIWHFMTKDAEEVVKGYRTANPDWTPMNEIAKLMNYIGHIMAREGWDIKSTIGRLLAREEMLTPLGLSPKRRKYELMIAQAIEAMRQLNVDEVEHSFLHWFQLVEMERKTSPLKLNHQGRCRKSELPLLNEPDFKDLTSFKYGSSYAISPCSYTVGWFRYKDRVTKIDDVAGSAVDLIPSELCELLGRQTPNWVSRAIAAPAGKALSMVCEVMSKRNCTSHKMFVTSIILWLILESQKIERTLQTASAEVSKSKECSIQLGAPVEDLQRTCDAYAVRKRQDMEAAEKQEQEIQAAKQTAIVMKAKAEKAEKEAADLKRQVAALTKAVEEKDALIKELREHTSTMDRDWATIRHVVELFTESADNPMNQSELSNPGTADPDLSGDNSADNSQEPTDTEKSVTEESSLNSSVAISSSGLDHSDDRRCAPRKRVGPKSAGRCTGAKQCWQMVNIK